MPYIERPGGTLHYLEVGEGPALLLLHAFPLHAGSFAAQRAALSAHYRIITPDARGLGESQGFQGPSTMDDMALDAFALLDALGIERAVVGGVSMGGYAAMAMVRADPTRIAGLILMNTHAHADDAAGKENRERTAQNVLQKGMGALVESMLPKLLSERATPALRAQVSQWIMDNTPAGAAGALRAMAQRADARELLSRFSAPSLVIAGESDAVVPHPKTEELASLLRCKHVTLPTGHLAHLEAPELVNASLEAFLAPLRGGSVAP